MSRSGIIAFWLIFPSCCIQANEELLRALSNKISPPSGIVKARLFHETRDAYTGTSFKVTITRDDASINTLIESFTRGRIIRILSLKQGSIVHAYRFQSKVLEDYSNGERIQKITGSNFSLSHFVWKPLDAKFKAVSAAPRQWKNENYKRLFLYPINESTKIKMILWYSDLIDPVPARIQYYINGILSKELEIKCGLIPERTEKGSNETINVCYQYKLVDLDLGSYSTLEWLSYDKRKIVDSRYFNIENIQE